MTKPDTADQIIEAATEVAQPNARTEAVDATVLATGKRVNARRVKTERKPSPRKAAITGASRIATPKAARKASLKAIPKIATLKAAKVANLKAAAKPATSQYTEERPMNFDATNWTSAQPFAALPGADRFQTMFTEAGSRGQQALEKGRTVVEQMTELTRANVEAVVEAGKIAATGAKSVGEDALQRTRTGLEQNVADFKSLAKAGSPTEFFQLQSEIARSNFDRMVATFSQLTEQSVKLAGEAIQPLSNRAAVNAEKLNELTA